MVQLNEAELNGCGLYSIYVPHPNRSI